MKTATNINREDAVPREAGAAPARAEHPAPAKTSPLIYVNE